MFRTRHCAVWKNKRVHTAPSSARQSHRFSYKACSACMPGNPSYSSLVRGIKNCLCGKFAIKGCRMLCTTTDS